MEMLFCQSCGMPMQEENLLGTNKDGSKNKEYCTYCYQNGEFAQPNMTMEEMIEVCVPFMKEDGMNPEEARALLKSQFPNLKRWSK